MNPLNLIRFDPKEHLDILWECYNSPEYVEFFRALQKGQTKDMLGTYEQQMGGQLYLLKCQGESVGFVVIFQYDVNSLSCQVGLLLFPSERDKMVLDKKVCAWALMATATFLFENFTIRKFTLLFLASRKDLIKSAERAGFIKEAEFIESCYCYGAFQNEIQYACFKTLYDQYKTMGLI